jgi:general secretion pathway protein D
VCSSDLVGPSGFAPARPGLLTPGGAGSSSNEAAVNTSGFSVDVYGGTIIYTGTEQQHKRVADLVKSFTEHIVGSRVDVRMYKLHNAEAESVADLLTQLIEDESSRAGTGTGTSPFLPASRVQGQRATQQTPAHVPTLEAPDAAASGEEGGTVPAASGAPVEISIVADADRNQILVKAPARQQAEIEQIIKRLDERRPQVYLEAQIVAINATNNFDWTVETQVNAGQFLLFSSFGLTAAGTAPAGGQAAQGVRTVPPNRTGLTTAVIKSDYVPFVLNTLASKTDSKIISNPRILVNDNETADLRSEREEPFATTTQGTATTTTGQGGVATAGTSLSVTPRISKGGYISLEYQIELSDFVGAPVAGLQPPTQREQFASIVTIPSDSTIIVGGFNLTRKSETDSGIPILKDIPIIGMLFKSFNVTDRRTTIFVFITPRIMTDPNFIDLRLASEGPIDKAGVEGITPELNPVTIRIEDQADSPSRLVPANEAPSGP